MRTPHFVILAVLLTGILGCQTARPAETPATAAAPNPAEQALSADPAVLRGTLPNGLAYYVRKNAKPQARAELRLVVNAGSLQEEDNEQGLAHFTEHMAFNGTEDFRKQGIVDYMESIGMSFGPEVNASTSFDETIYKLMVPTEDPTVLETGLRILEQWAHEISFDPEEVTKEAPVIVEEWRLRRGADSRMREAQYPLLYKDSRYAVRLPIGKMDVVQKATAADLRRFYAKWYRPDLMAVMAVGDFDPKKVVDLITRLFGAIQAPAAPPARVVFPVPDNPGTLYAPATDPEATSTRVSLYLKRDPRPVKTPADYRREIVESLSDGILNARLAEIAARPDSPLAAGGAFTTRIARSKEAYVLSARVRDDRVRDALETLLTEAERVRRHGFTDTELQREKKDLLAGVERYYADRDNIPSDQVIGSLIDNYLRGEPIPDVETEYGLYTRFVPAITLGEVNASASALVAPDNRVVLVSAPEKQAKAVAAAAQVEDTFRAVAAADVRPYEDSAAARPLFSARLQEVPVVSRTEVAEIGATVWKLANGVTVTVKPTDFRNDQVLFSAYSPGGSSLVPDADFAASLTAAGIVAESGVDGFDATQLRKQLAGNSATVTPWIDELQEGLRGSARPSDLETLFQLIYLYMTEPRRDAEAFQVYRQRLRTNVENRASSPQGVFYDTLQKLLAQDNPRGSPWSVDRVQQVDLDDALRVYRDRFKDAGDFHFFFVGNVTPGQVEPLARRYLGSLPTQGRVESWKDLGIDPPKGVVRRDVKRGIEQQSRVELVFSGKTGWSLTDRMLMEGLSRVLDIRLRETVREGAGGSYDVGVSGELDRYPDQEYYVYVGFGCAPDRVDALTALVLQEVARMRDQGPEAVDVAKVKEILLREHEQSMKQNQYWLSTLQMLSLNGLDLREIQNFDARLAALTAESIRAKAAELLRPDNYAEVVLYPEGKTP